MTLPSPAQLLGLPKFVDWNPGQSEACSQLLDWYYSDQRFCGLAAPTGVGKTLLALLIAKLSGTRTVILTATKGLQSQYMTDALPLGAALVKGQNNFACSLVPGITADQGPCHEGLPCEYRQNSCGYRLQLDKALQSKMVVTNYAYWLAQTRFSSGLGDVKLLILDEGHEVFGALESHMAVFLSKMDIEALGIVFPTSSEELADWDAWQRWAIENLPTATEEAKSLEEEIKSRRSRGLTVPGSLSHAFRSAKAISARLESMSNATGAWVIQRTYHGWHFTPRWVSPYGSVLFQQVPKVLLMSAILTPKTADSVGVPSEPENRTWIDVPSYFPPGNTPIWHVPTARINYRTDDYGSSIWCTRIDQIIQRRLDRKGIVFTVSFERARMLVDRSSHADIMVTHSTSDVVHVVEGFKEMEPPAVLVSPSVTTGWDFDEDSGVRYIIVGKIPYPDTKDPVMQARTADDPEWTSYLAMGTLVQEAGRATRSPTQRTEVLVVDDNIVWYVKRYAAYAPKWFIQRYRGSLRFVPEPLV